MLKEINSFFSYINELILLGYMCFRSVFFHRAVGVRDIIRVVLMQVYFTGVQALPLIGLMGLLVGVLVIIQAIPQLSRLGAGESLGQLMVVVILRELSPLLTAFVVVARSGTAVASELGNMVVNREVTALESMGISQIQYVVAPRFFGGIISVVCLAFYFNIVALVGGFICCSFFVKNMILSFYILKIVEALNFSDIMIFLLKNFTGGAMIFLISALNGLRVHGASTEVPIAAKNAVVQAILFCVIFNTMVTVTLYILEGKLISL
jgi:phospholipid/cholesterol/gamma-HCH transport system permease protein